jgi:hypothetical protein
MKNFAQDFASRAALIVMLLALCIAPAAAQQQVACPHLL